MCCGVTIIIILFLRHLRELILIEESTDAVIEFVDDVEVAVTFDETTTTTTAAQ